jgi:hypothetical protein
MASNTPTTSTPTPWKRWAKGIAIAVVLLAISVILFFSYTQFPLYSSNQNTYLVRGLADGGLGLLDEDWYANTTEPFPVFGALVTFTYQVQEALFYLYAAILVGVYLCALLAVAWTVAQQKGSAWLYFLLAGFLILLHSRWMLNAYKGAAANLTEILAQTAWLPDWNLETWVRFPLVDGMAGQYLLGPTFQPSMFGPLLLVSIWAYLRHKPYAAVIIAGIAATIHPTYLLSAAALTVAYMIGRYLETRDWKSPLSIGLTSLAVVTPILVYSQIQFPQRLPLAQEILATRRIPHHAVVSEWWRGESTLKVVIMLLGIWLARRTRLFLPLLVSFLIGAALTGIQIATGSHTVALLFPWRLSCYLVPLSLTLILFRPLQGLERLAGKKGRVALVAFGVGVWILVGIAARFGLVWTTERIEQRYWSRFGGVTNYVRKRKDSGDTYLVPVNMQNFRLDTGVPILADWKSHPYRSDEFLEWYERVQRARAFYRASPRLKLSILEDIRNTWDITHILMPANQCTLDHPDLAEIYHDGRYCIYRISD